MISLSTSGIRLAFDPRIGMIDGFTVQMGGAEISPLHRAPWVGTDEVLPYGLPPHLYALGGDFFCAPFGQEKDGAPMHGWPPNAPWTVHNSSPDRLCAQLEQTVSGAEVTKELWLCPDHPFVYQRHTFVGGAGRVPVANHANVSLIKGGLIRTSAKHGWATPPAAPEPDPGKGRSALVYPAQSTDPTAFPGLDGPVDLTRYPWRKRHEEFVVGIEAKGHTLGWTAVSRPVEGDLFLSLRNASALPMTMLWHSNGGRDYPPWSGRHFGCLGVEEGAAEHMLGPDHGMPLTGSGALALFANKAVSVNHVIGAIAWPEGEPVASITLSNDMLTVTGEGDAQAVVPFDASALELDLRQ